MSHLRSVGELRETFSPSKVRRSRYPFSILRFTVLFLREGQGPNMLDTVGL